jgi:hypothetical protein
MPHETHPGDAEAAAAIAAMHDLYGSPPVQGEGRYRHGRLVSTYAVGDTVSVWLADGHRNCTVIATPQGDDDDETYVVVEHIAGGGRIHHAVSVDAIAPW